MYKTFLSGNQSLRNSALRMRKKPLTGNGALPPLPLQSAVGSQYLIN